MEILLIILVWILGSVLAFMMVVLYFTRIIKVDVKRSDLLFLIFFSLSFSYILAIMVGVDYLMSFIFKTLKDKTIFKAKK